MIPSDCTLPNHTVPKPATLAAVDEHACHAIAALGTGVVTTTVDGTTVVVNPAAAAMIGARAEALVDRPIEDVLRIEVHAHEQGRTRSILDDVIRTQRLQRSGDGAHLRSMDGAVLGIDYSAAPLIDAHGRLSGVVYALHDVTAQRQRARAIAWRATHDPLTGVINRGEFERRLKKLLQHAGADGDHRHALLYIDVDKFKFINDSYGHAAGDRVLEEAIEIMRTAIRGADTLGRIGGDEFAAILYSCTHDKARQIAEGLRAAVADHEFAWHGIALRLSLSIGIVEIDLSCTDPNELMRAADAACYRAKQAGRNRIDGTVGGDTPHGGQTTGFDIVKRVQRAIRNDNLDLLQHTARRTGTPPHSSQDTVAVLDIGLRDEAGGYLHGTALTALLDRYQLGIDIDRWVLGKLLDGVRREPASLGATERILIPLSRQALAADEFLAWLDTRLRQDPASGPRLGFAIDITGLDGETERMRYFISTVAQHGCQFMLTNPGIASIALDLLRTPGVAILGIDQVLVERLQGDSAAYEATLGLCRTARACGLQSMAFGADSTALVDSLARMGVDYTLAVRQPGPRPTVVMPRGAATLQAICCSRPGTASARTSG